MAAMSTIAIGMAVGAVVGGGAAAIQSGGDFNAIWKGALVGAAAGGIGGWAAPALAPTLGITSAAGIGALGGGIAGVSGGLLNAAINGGTGEDYWKGALFGGLGGAATGALAGGLGETFGSTAANATPTGADGMVTGTPYTSDVTGATTPLTDAGASTLSSAPVASGVSGTGADASGAVQASITGAPTAAPEYAMFGGDTVSPTVTASASGTPTNTIQPLSQSAFGSGNTVTTGTTDFVGTDITGTPTGTTEYAPFGSDVAAKPTEFAPFGGDTVTGASGADKGTGAYWEKYLPNGAPKDPSAFDNFKGWLSQKTAGYPSVNTGGKGMGDMLGKVMMGNMMGQALKGVGSVAGMNEARQNQGQLMDLYNTQMNQYQQQNAAANQYQNQLGETYSNPDAYLSSPEALASRQLAMQKLLAQNAAAGRRTAGLPMQQQLMMNQLSNLNAYRTGLSNAARGAYPGSAEVMAKTLGAAQAQSPTGNLMAGLGSMFAPAATYYLL